MRGTGERRSAERFALEGDSAAEAPSFTFHNAGRFDGDQHDLFMVTCWDAAHVSCGVHSVREPALQANVAALERKGYVNRTERHESWDFGARAWVCTGGWRRAVPTSAGGLPIVSTEPLTAAERESLHQLGRALRLAADRVDEAVATNRVAHGLEACALAGDAGLTARRVGVTLGSRR